MSRNVIGVDVAPAAAIVKGPAALVLEEPTRGVDIGSKEEIYRLLRDYAADGHAVILYCTEVPEVCGTGSDAQLGTDPGADAAEPTFGGCD